MCCLAPGGDLGGGLAEFDIGGSGGNAHECLGEPRPSYSCEWWSAQAVTQPSASIAFRLVPRVAVLANGGVRNRHS